MINACFSPLALAASYLNPEAMESACRVLLEDAVAPQTMPFARYLAIFILTCALETPVYWFFLRRPLGPFRPFGAIFILNLATHPVVTWIFPWIFVHTPLLTRDYLLISEMFAIGVEAALLFQLYKIGLKKSFLISLAANLFSWWAGLYLAG